MSKNLVMEVRKIKVRDLVNEYVNDIDEGVYAYGGKLEVRPPYQREFCYDDKRQKAVIDTILKEFPLNIMYWVLNDDGSYECLDGQQRIISICRFADGVFSIDYNGMPTTIHRLQRIAPELAETFYNYELTVYICKGSKTEQMGWFRTINIAGLALTEQELRNANYVSAWLADAKRYFARSTDGSKCPAERIGEQYIATTNVTRQALLEKVIEWYTEANHSEDTDTTICNYMCEMSDKNEDASELWQYYNNVVEWVAEMFPFNTDSKMKTVPWGYIYNDYHDTDFDPEELDKELQQLCEEEEVNASKGKLYEYLFRKNEPNAEKLLHLRTFNEVQKRQMYARQKGICPECGGTYDIKKMEGHHIKPWHLGGKTEIDNGVMLCKSCHKYNH